MGICLDTLVLIHLFQKQMAKCRMERQNITEQKATSTILLKNEILDYDIKYDPASNDPLWVSTKMQRGSVYTEGFYQQVVEEMRREPIGKVSQRWGLTRSTLKRWALKSGITTVSSSQGYSPEVQASAVKCYKTKGIDEACRRFGVDKLTVYKWNGGSQGRPKVYSVETKEAVLKSYREVGISETVRKFKVGSRTVQRWYRELGGEKTFEGRQETLREAMKGEGNEDGELMLQKKKRTFSSAFKAQVLASYTRWGPVAAARQFGVTKGLVLQWRRIAGHPRIPKTSRSPPLIDNEVKLETESELESVAEAKLETDIRPQSNSKTETKCKPKSRQGLPRTRYTPEVKNAALKLYREHGVLRTLRTFDISSTRTWPGGMIR